MAEKNKGNSSGNYNLYEDADRSLPTTSTSTPMPEVKPPKETTGSSSGDNSKK